MAVRIRMKQMGRTHRPFYRICAIDKRSPRDGKVLELLGTYDPMIADKNARTQLNKERIDYWLSVGAQPSEKMAVLIKKYGTDGTHAAENDAAIEKLAQPRAIPERGEPAIKQKTAEEIAAEEAAAKAEEEAKNAPAEETKADESSADTQTAAESEIEPTATTDVEAVSVETTGEAIKEDQTPADTVEKPVD